jgi:hypothetical protein
MNSEQTIRQITPATGWRVVTVFYGDGKFDVREEPVVCFALLDPPNHGPEQPVVPMVRDRGYYPSKSRGTFDIVLGDANHWDNLAEGGFDEAFVGYLAPGEELTAVWVQNVIAQIRRAVYPDPVP